MSISWTRADSTNEFLRICRFFFGPSRCGRWTKACLLSLVPFYICLSIRSARLGPIRLHCCRVARSLVPPFHFSFLSSMPEPASPIDIPFGSVGVCRCVGQSYSKSAWHSDKWSSIFGWTLCIRIMRDEIVKETDGSALVYSFLARSMSNWNAAKSTVPRRSTAPAVSCRRNEKLICREMRTTTKERERAREPMVFN